jgi:hypothetical protein
MGFTVARSRIVEIDVLSDAERLRHLDLPVSATGRPRDAGDVAFRQ